MKTITTPSVTLVGAGPGDPDLITLKGLKAIKNANIILYDALSSIELLNYAKSDCKKLYVGKRRGCKSNKQEVINELLVYCAFKYGNVVRLKGGDPFVFGRGYEELAHLDRHGIITNVIPGISSCISVPASIGIPLTCRNVNESFWVTTGTLSNGEISKDIALAAQSNATVVILMGLNKLNEIVEIFRQYGKSNLPAAVIQNGTMSNQKHVIGTVTNILTKSKEANLSTPAVIIIGEVVNLKPKEIDQILNYQAQLSRQTENFKETSQISIN